MTDDGQPETAGSPEDKEPRNTAGYLPLGISLGLSIGIVFGLVIFDNIGLGISLGLAIGAGLGLALSAGAEKRPGGDESGDSAS